MQERVAGEKETRPGRMSLRSDSIRSRGHTPRVFVFFPNLFTVGFSMTFNTN